MRDGGERGTRSGWTRGSSLYKELDSLRSDPSFSDRAGQVYSLYMEKLIAMPPRQRKYYLDRDRLRAGQRAYYEKSVGHGARGYGSCSLADGTSVSSLITVRRTDFPEGPEGTLLYRKAYNREWYALRSKRRQGIKYNVSEKVIAARKTRRTRWDTDRGRELLGASTGKKAAAQHIVRLHKDMDAMLKSPAMLEWSVQGGVLYRRVEDSGNDSLSVSDGTWTLAQFYHGLLYEDGEVSLLVNGVLPLLPGDLQGTLTGIVPRIRESVSDAVVLRGMYDRGEELPDDVRGEINLLRTKEDLLLRELAVLRRGMKKHIWRNTVPDMPLDVQLRPLLVVGLLRSGLLAARWSERRGLYLYYRFHKFQMYRRQVKMKARRTENGRRGQFGRLDRALGTDPLASARYWEGKVHTVKDEE